MGHRTEPEHAILQVSGLSISFDGLRALEGVSFEVPRGSIFGLIGPNGAGKSTLINCLTRIYIPDRGAVRLNGTDLLAMQAHDLVLAGLVRTFQNLELASDWSALDNVATGSLARKNIPLWADLLGLRSARQQFDAARQTAFAAMEKLGIAWAANAVVKTLPYGVQKKIELARALAAEPSLLLLDEPAAGLNPDETDALGEVLREIRATTGLTIVLIEHDMKFVMGLCEQLVVLDHGEVISSGAPAQVQQDPKVIEAYLGEDHDATA